VTDVEDNAERNHELDGISLLPLFKDPSAELKRDFLCWHYPHYYYGMNTPVGSIRQGDWKLLEYFEDGRLELYNLADDVSEEHELSASQPDVARRLRSQLRAWRRRVDAPMPTPNPNWKR
jgi:arylsulfatase A-like enzyme